MTEYPQNEDYENMLPRNYEEAVFSINIVKLANKKLQNDWVKYQTEYKKHINDLQFKIIDLNKKLCAKQDRVDSVEEEF